MTVSGLRPFVFWGQNKENVFLRVLISDVVGKPVIDFKVKSVSFKCRGKGISGVNDYSFNLDFLHPIDSKKSSFHKTATSIELVAVKKSEDLKWERLQEQNVKIPWLKIDFDRFAFDSSDESEDENKKNNYENLYKTHDMFKKDSFQGTDTVTNLKTYYLIIFNLFQFFGYASILYSAFLHFYYKDNESTETTSTALFSMLGQRMMICQSLAFLELFHALLRWTKSNFLTSLMQVLGRGFILFVLIWPEERFHNKPIIGYLFITWSAVEVFRYPYYVFSSLKMDFPLLTWIRYTIWIPLYPLGSFFEGTIMIMALPLFESSGRFNYLLPNRLNLHFHFCTFLITYMGLFLLGMGLLMNRMYLQRKKKFNINPKKIGKKVN